jgi:Delta7-sterol 5-desaturase
LTHYSFEFYGFIFFGIILARYAIFAGGTHLLLDRAFGKTTVVSAAASVEQGTDTNGERLDNTGSAATSRGNWLTPMTIADIKLSILSSVVFALSAATIASAYDAGIVRLYADIHQYPLWYLGLSYIVTIVLQDAYFYLMHRLFHHRLLFRWWHQGHHRSNPPTPWTSFAFDPLEAIVHSLFLVGIVFLIPLHFITLLAVLSTMTVWAVVNHLGLDRLPANFPHHWCGRWFTGPAHHAIHHHHYALHFGLYFTFWDRQLGTQSPKYEQEFAHVTN